ncbi:uncharacterized protein LOC127841685 isoform X2 [Dreissena polymorpha]|uniref:uncharacterized protein LOC127841685 isoform X2 n=1 Tax=Dreissena polymorpha TaxID=45954 RepID=UPI0022641DB2|nr:uncharacterized protein LOC127841685 isoform X2 [Dreissena polymorpha]
MTATVDDSLREQSKLLLRRLKDKQTQLQDIVNPSVSEEPTGANVKSPPSITYTRQSAKRPQVKIPVRRLDCDRTNLKEKVDTSLQKSVTERSAVEGKARLCKRQTQSKEDTHKNYQDDNCTDHKENYMGALPEKNVCSKIMETPSNEPQSRDTNPDLSDLRKDIEAEHMDQLKTFGKISDDSLFIENRSNETGSGGSATPNTLRKRRIIDRNVRVNGVRDLNASELMREVEDDYTRLNYSYSNVDDTDLKFLQERLAQAELADTQDCNEVPVRDTDSDPETPGYAQNLDDPANSRKIAKFIRDTKKPKSILLSNNTSRLNKSSTANASRVSFRSPSRDASGNLTYEMDSFSRQQQRMLGYDWIAALIENDPNAVNQSETFFDELREFRKLNMQECSNQMYMDGPQELWEHPEREPEPVQRALEETKVKPYIVNERLFAEPIQRSLFAGYDYQETEPRKDNEKPTYEEPRFVRVSIPRSTLAAPSRVKPHRRNSFDAADSMALSKHCMKGWNSTQPSMMPASRTIGLRDDTTALKSAVRTTLDDAETLAANFPYEWNAKEQSISRPLPRPTYRPEAKYADSTWPSALKGNVKGSYSGAYKGDISAYRSDTTGLKGNISSSYTGAYPGESSGSYLQASDGLQRATDELLNSTYSLMYEMKRLKHERSDNPILL